MFVQYVRGFPDDDLTEVERLPFRRTLAVSEREQVWSEIKARWGIEGYWYPLSAKAPKDALALDAEPFFDAETQTRLREALAAIGVSRVWELREFDVDPESPDRELDLEFFEPVYTGAEGFWTDRSLDWLIYASHEDSVTVAGRRLLPAFKHAVPEWAKWIYPTAPH